MARGDRLIGIDLGGTKIEGIVLDREHRQVARKRIATEQEGGYAHILARIAGLVGELRREAPGCERIGIGTPGALAARDRTLKNSNTQCLNGKPLLSDLEAKLGLAVRMENDANCFALAEALAGAGRGRELVFGVILGTGVGGGIVIRGAIWPGPQHIAGEWGHHAIDPAGPHCYCGQRGCVETLISGPALEAAYRAAVAPTASPAAARDEAARGAAGTAGTPAADAAAAGPAPVTAAEIAARAARGEPAACAVIDAYVRHFGRAMANLIAILDPSAVVLGGGLSNLDLLYTRGRDAVARSIFNDELTTPILRNELGDSAGVIGAALLSAA